MGLIGLMDPPRAEAKQAIVEFQEAGIVVKMITGEPVTIKRPLPRSRRN